MAICTDMRKFMILAMQNLVIFNGFWKILMKPARQAVWSGGGILLKYIQFLENHNDHTKTFAKATKYAKMYMKKIHS
jgi:hypothetical protein